MLVWKFYTDASLKVEVNIFHFLKVENETSTLL